MNTRAKAVPSALAGGRVWDGWPFTAKQRGCLWSGTGQRRTEAWWRMGETGACMNCSDCGSNQASLCVTCHERKCVTGKRKKSDSGSEKAVDERVPKRAHLHSDRQKLRVKMLGALPKIGTKRAKAVVAAYPTMRDIMEAPEAHVASVVVRKFTLGKERAAIIKRVVQ